MSIYSKKYTREQPDALLFARRATQVQSPTLPLPPPRDAATTESFLTWVATMPRDQVQDVREAIAAMTEKPTVAAVLNEQLFSLPCSDVSRHLLLLSTIGELRETSSIAALERFTWLRDEQIFNTIPPVEGKCSFSTAGMLQARAAEMMAWILQGNNDDLVLRVIRDHPSDLVRTAAIDGYLFQHGDTPEAIEFLLTQVKTEDQWMIGLPRFGADTDRETFERAIAEHEAAYPSNVRRPQKRGFSIWRVICTASAIGLAILLALKLIRTSKVKRSTPHVH